jgi:hypothetical protein
MTTYDNIVRAAERLLTDETKDTWTLADAVLAHVPEGSQGGNTQHSPDIGGMLRSLADQLKQDGVTTMTNTAYTVSSLTHLRDTAVAWPKTERYTEASFSTHREAAENKAAREALGALVNVARGGTPNRPRGFDLRAWNEAVGRVRNRTRDGFKVSVDDVRIARRAKPTRPHHRKLTIDRIHELIVQYVDKGQDEQDLEDLLHLLPNKIGNKPAAAYVTKYVDEYVAAIAAEEARLERIRNTVAAGEEEMTDEELQESDEDLTALLGASEDVKKDMAQAQEEMYGSKWVQYLEQGTHYTGTALQFQRKFGVTDRDRELAIDKITRQRHLLDLIEMGMEGKSLSDEDASWLEAMGIKVA